MAEKASAIECCAYCRAYVPVTYVEIPSTTATAPIQARVAVCNDCFDDGR